MHCWAIISFKESE
jgi:bifunctional ADP-heptose synthase (sugar kinase/adenylyltransferase)